MEDRKKPQYRRGIMVLVVLAMMTALEFELAIMGAPAALLIIIAAIKAAAVLVYFMHINRVFSPEKGEH
jgi:heme/copper-type cytochrome/quinol oxidase subunit 4